MEQGVRKRVDQDLVWSVCDRLLADGTRPTIERIRERVGGSPNTVSGHLESWFKTLSARMAALSKGETVPLQSDVLPEGVLALAKQLWVGAGEAARAEAAKDVERIRLEAEDRVARAEEARRTAEVVLQERGERVLVLELELSRAEDARRVVEREREGVAAELGHALGRVEEMGRTLLGAQSDLRDARQALVRREQEAEAAARAAEESQAAERKNWLMEIDRARTDAAKAAKREEQVSQELVRVRQELSASGEVRAQLEVRLEQANAETRRARDELESARRAWEGEKEGAAQREAELQARVEEGSRQVAAMASEVRKAHEAIEGLRGELESLRVSVKGAPRRGGA